MSEERDTPPARAAETPDTDVTPGAPVAEAMASDTDVMRAVQRAHDSQDEAASAVSETALLEDAAAADPALTPDTQADSALTDHDAAEQARREAVAAVDTQLDMAPATTPLTAAAESETHTLDELPSAADEGVLGAASTTALPPVRDGEIRISADHPMAALYMQTPMPPVIRGNRGAGVLIGLLATVVFAALYLGVIALWISQDFPPSQFLAEGLMPWLTSWLFIIPVVAFFVGLSLLVLVVGRAGWWAYVLGGFLVAALVWVAATVTLSWAGTPYASPEEMLPGFTLSGDNLQAMLNRFGLTVPVIAAACVAREVTVWFGAWIGARGRRMKLRNAEALAEYETALAEAQAK